jgi:RND family efflux transporter MFP subunit
MWPFENHSRADVRHSSGATELVLTGEIFPVAEMACRQLLPAGSRRGCSPKACAMAAVVLLAGIGLVSCGRNQVNATNSPAAGDAVSVAVTKAVRKTLEQKLTVSSELVPFQEIDVYAKESGYVKQLDVDYGTRVKAGQVMAVLEIPELQLQLQEDDAAIKAADDQVKRLGRQVDAVEARSKVLHSYYDRLAGVWKENPKLLAQQEVDDAQGKDLTGQADVEAARANLETAQSQAEATRAKRKRDGALADYAKIPAPFDGVVTQRYANYGTLLQAGTNSSAQALVQLSEDDTFRLVIPVPETYVRYIHLNDPVSVNVPSLNRVVPGKVARFSVHVKEETRTMHTEVDVPNADRTLVPGLYADATIQLQRKQGALSVPSQALNRDGDRVTVDVVGPSNKIEVRPVVTGIETAQDVEIVSGVNEGDLVITGDRSGLKAGQQVTPKIVSVMEYQEEK